MSQEDLPGMSRWTLSVEEAEAWLDEVVDEIPEALLRGLNGGIVFSEAVQPSPHGAGLYTLGQYFCEPMGLGRYIVLYYGSFVRVYGQRPPSVQKKELRKLLLHELTHHVESLAGVRDLEWKDEEFLRQYRGQNHETD